MMQLACVDPSRVPDLWPTVGPMIRWAVEQSTNTDFLSVTSKLANRQALLWLVLDGEQIRAAVVTSINAANGKKRCVIVACGGEGMTDWLPLIGQIEDYAKAEGCISVAVMGRRGWERKLKNYRPVAVTLEKAL